MGYFWIVGLVVAVIIVLIKVFSGNNSSSDERREGEIIGDYLRRNNIITIGDKIQCHTCGKIDTEAKTLDTGGCIHCGSRWERTQLVIVTCGNCKHKFNIAEENVNQCPHCGVGWKR
jgi:DNA-directed RNA polymerase subunit RPC12/RpoP